MKKLFIPLTIIFVLSCLIFKSVSAETTINITLGNQSGEWDHHPTVVYLTTDGTPIDFFCPWDTDQVFEFTINDGMGGYYNPYCIDLEIQLPAGTYQISWRGDAPYTQYYSQVVTVYTEGTMVISASPPAATPTPIPPTEVPTVAPPPTEVTPPTEVPSATPTDGIPTDTPTFLPFITATIPPTATAGGGIVIPTQESREYSILYFFVFVYTKFLLDILLGFGDNNEVKRIRRMITLTMFVFIDFIILRYTEYDMQTRVYSINMVFFLVFGYWESFRDFISSLTRI